MNIIEQAAKRLEELRKAGIDLSAEGLAPAARRMPVKEHLEEGNTITTAPVAPIARVVEPSVLPGRLAPYARNDTPFEPTARKSSSITIDLARLAARGYITPDSPRTQLADEFRVVKRPLLTNAFGKSSVPVKQGNLIMITSSMPGEGKTYASINLAMSIAMELDRTVLLVDADVARPAVLERLGLRNTKGLLDLLTDPELELSDVMFRTNVEKLSILPAGTHHPRATELLASEGMSRLLDDLASRYTDRIVIFDAPPLLPSTESRVLATHMGQVVVVVEFERTQQSAVSQALSTIEACPVVHTMLNKVVGSETASYYGYYGNAPY